MYDRGQDLSAHLNSRLIGQWQQPTMHVVEMIGPSVANFPEPLDNLNCQKRLEANRMLVLKMLSLALRLISPFLLRVLLFRMRNQCLGEIIIYRLKMKRKKTKIKIKVTLKQEHAIKKLLMKD